MGVLAPATSALLHNTSTLCISMHSMTNLLPEDIDKDFDQFLKMFTWNYLQKHFIKQDNLSVTKEEALAEAKSLAAAQFAQYGMPSAPEEMLAGYAEKILADKDQGQKIYEKLYETKVVEDVKSKIKVTEKAVSADDFAKLAKAL